MSYISRVPWSFSSAVSPLPNNDHPLTAALDHLWIPASGGATDIISGLFSPNSTGTSQNSIGRFVQCTSANLANANDIPRGNYPIVLVTFSFSTAANYFYTIFGEGSGSEMSLAHMGTGAVRMTVRRNFGTQRQINTVGTVADRVSFCAIGQIFSDTDYRLFANGEQVNGSASFGTGGSGISSYEPIGGQGNGGIYLAGIGFGRRAISDDLAKVISANPRTELPKLFRPLERRIWVPGIAGNTYSVSSSESATASDAASATATWAAAASESASSTDAATSLQIAVVSVAETVSSADVVAFDAATYSVSATETVSASDVVAALAELVAAQSETLSAADSIAVAMVIASAVSESTGATDVTDWGGAAYSVEITETGTLQDAVAAALEGVAALQETASAGETVLAIMSMGAAVLDAATAAELVAATADLVALLTESVSADDVVSTGAGVVYSADAAESASAVDVVVATLIRGFVVITVPPMHKRSGGAMRSLNLPAMLRPGNKPGRGR